MPSRSPFINQVRIAIIVAQSLLRKAIQDKELPVEDGSQALDYLDSSLTKIRPHVKKQETD
jgi:hypothetical protein